MKLLVVINDTSGKWLEYQCTGVLNQLDRRVVEIELTKDQIDKIGLKQIGLKQIGTAKGEPMYETIESVTLKIK